MVKGLLLLIGITACLATAPWYPAGPGRAESHSDWHYETESEWQHSYPECAGSAQSPVVLTKDEAEKAHPEFLRIHMPITPAVPLTLLNNGHTIQLNVADAPTPRPILVATSISPYIYEVIQIHVHSLSEHILEGQQSILEIHVVCQAVDRSARGSRAPTMVLGYLYKVGPTKDAFLSDILTHAHTLPEEGTNKTITIFPKIPRLDKYFHYQGSFTTPPCTEGVEWLVGAQMLTATQEQITAFVEKIPHEISSGNARSVQPLNGRVVKLRTFTQDPLSNLHQSAQPQTCAGGPGDNILNVQVGN